MKLYQILNRDCIGKKFRFKGCQDSEAYCEVINDNGFITYHTIQRSYYGNIIYKAREGYYLDKVLSDEIVEINNREEFKFKCLCCGGELKIHKEFKQIRGGMNSTILNELEIAKIICKKCTREHSIEISFEENNFGYTLELV